MNTNTNETNSTRLEYETPALNDLALLDSRCRIVCGGGTNPEYTDEEGHIDEP